MATKKRLIRTIRDPMDILQSAAEKAGTKEELAELRRFDKHVSRSGGKKWLTLPDKASFRIERIGKRDRKKPWLENEKNQNVRFVYEEEFWNAALVARTAEAMKFLIEGSGGEISYEGKVVRVVFEKTPMSKAADFIVSEFFHWTSLIRLTIGDITQALIKQAATNALAPPPSIDDLTAPIPPATRTIRARIVRGDRVMPSEMPSSPSPRRRR